ncbi:MAG: cytochrome C oxidase subunit IV family protein [Polyangiaceae bacterium]|nr:cytochrome C oxidase subunit IV family protein [Polyangiaceae bacterium]MCW5792559.1 cytochrome C oxidase subunit IV family protein [Polyangiaceae bacterium]
MAKNKPTKTSQGEAKAEQAADEAVVKSDAHGGHGGGHGGHGGHDDEHLAHTMSIKMLVGVWGALMVLTVLTVSVTGIDLGYTLNLVVAMVIATIKAALVMLFFMHLWWDKKFNVVVFVSSFLFVLLFVALTLNDRGEYQADIETYRQDKAQQ